MVVTIDAGANTAPEIFIAGGGNPTPTDYSEFGNTYCAGYPPEPGANFDIEYNWGTNGLIKGIGFFRGAGSQAIADYWHAYDWG